MFVIRVLLGSVFGFSGLSKVYSSALDTPQVLSDYHYNNFIKKGEFPEGYLDNITFPPDSEIEHVLIREGKRVYKSNFSIGPYLNRLVDPSVKLKNDFVILMGGSNMFGHWLQDEQTIAQNLQIKLGNKIKVFNLACPGCSLATNFYNLQNSQIHKNLLGKKGVIFYLFYDFHVLRDNCLPPAIFWNRGRLIYYDIVEGKRPEVSLCNDLFRSKLALWAKDTVEAFPWLIKILPRYNHFDQLNKKHIDKTINLARQVKHYFSASNVDFLFFESPFEVNFDSKLRDYLKEKLIGIANYNESLKVPEEKRNKFRFAFDNHLNSEGAKLIANDFFERGNLQDFLKE